MKELKDGSYEYYLRKNGSYQVTASGDDGSKGTAITIEVSGIVEEKFGQAYSASEYYTDSNNAKARIPKGFSVGTSSNINTIANGLVITDKVNENGIVLETNMLVQLVMKYTIIPFF